MVKSFLVFKEIKDTGKTKIWRVESQDENSLGLIQWWVGWRRYVFVPNEGTLFDSGCLKEITTFIDAEMQKRKK